MSTPSLAQAVGPDPVIQPRRLAAEDSTGLRAWLGRPFVLWGLLWLSINTGPWSLAGFGAGMSGSVAALRAVLSLVVAVVAFASLSGRRTLRRKRSWVERGFWLYGVVMLLACTAASGWFAQSYWGLAFLATLAIVEHGLRGEDPLGFAAKLNWVSWLITSAALATMLFMARDVLYATGSDSAYGLIVRFQDAYGYGISRETGLSRMAAIPAIIALAFLFSRKSWQKAVSLTVFVGACYVIWIMQSRGALFAFAGAFTFVLLFGQGVQRVVAIVLLTVVGIVVLVAAVPVSTWSDLWLHASRGHGTAGLSMMSGRPFIWQQALEEWSRSPLIGYGPQADRLFGFNAQNALLYALLSAGLVGTTFFLLAMTSSWKALLSLVPVAGRLPDRERRMFQITGAILVFATLRSIPENNAAVFSVDLLLQYPAMIYLTILAARVRQARREAAHRPVRVREPFAPPHRDLPDSCPRACYPALPEGQLP